MTAVYPSESSPDGAEAGTQTAGSKGSGAGGTTGTSSVTGVKSADSHGDSIRGSIGSTVASTSSSQRNARWSRQDSSDINTDDEGATVRRLTPLERLNLDMCQDERYGDCKLLVIFFIVGFFFSFSFFTCQIVKIGVKCFII